MENEYAIVDGYCCCTLFDLYNIAVYLSLLQFTFVLNHFTNNASNDGFLSNWILLFDLRKKN